MSPKSLANLPVSPIINKQKNIQPQTLPGQPMTGQPVPNPQGQPGQPQIPQNMQNVWQAYFAGKHQEVLQQSEQALFRTGNVDYIHLTGLSMVATGRVKDGLEWLRASITLFPSPAWFSNAAIIALEANQVDAAMEFAKKGLEKFPDDSKLNFNLGNILLKQQQYGPATEAYCNALAAEPEMMGAILNIGNCFNRLGFKDIAEGYYKQVLDKDVNNELASINISILLTEQARYAEAKNYLNNPNIAHNKELQFLKSMLLLGEGNYEEGWPMYKQRWNSIMAGELGIKRIDRLPHSLEDMKGKHVLLHHEQGFGDSLQFVRYATMVLPHAGKVSLLTPKPLHRLFSLIDPRINIVDAGQPYDKNAYDYEAGLMDLPEIFGTKYSTVPNQIPYFSVPQELISQYKLPRTDNLKVGLCWAGQLRNNPDLKAIDRRRSMKISHFDVFNDLKGIDFYSLQLGDPANTIQSTEFGRKMKIVLNPNFDFLDSAAIIKQLDLVIVVDTSCAHLSAGLGVPTAILNRLDRCWRWLHPVTEIDSEGNSILNEEGKPILKFQTDSVWYPGSVKLYTQNKMNSWVEPLAELKSDLERWAKFPKTIKKSFDSK
jgi:tetratricopeptide (TPR) repeat protein